MIRGITDHTAVVIAAWKKPACPQSAITQRLTRTDNSPLIPGKTGHADPAAAAAIAPGKMQTGATAKSHVVLNELANSSIDASGRSLVIRTTPQRCDNYLQLLEKCGITRQQGTHSVTMPGYQVVSRAGQLELHCYLPPQGNERALESVLSKAQQLFQDERAVEKNILALLADHLLSNSGKNLSREDEITFVMKKLRYCDLNQASKALRLHKSR